MSLGPPGQVFKPLPATGSYSFVSLGTLNLGNVDNTGTVRWWKWDGATKSLRCVLLNRGQSYGNCDINESISFIQNNDGRRFTHLRLGDLIYYIANPLTNSFLVDSTNTQITDTTITSIDHQGPTLEYGIYPTQ